MSLSPKCCENSKDYRTVVLFIPAPGQNVGISWNVPIRIKGSEELAEHVSTQVPFCPFCGKRLGLEDVPFEESPLASISGGGK